VKDKYYKVGETLINKMVEECWGKRSQDKIIITFLWKK